MASGLCVHALRPRAGRSSDDRSDDRSDESGASRSGSVLCERTNGNNGSVRMPRRWSAGDLDSWLGVPGALQQLATSQPAGSSSPAASPAPARRPRQRRWSDSVPDDEDVGRIAAAGVNVLHPGLVLQQTLRERESPPTEGSSLRLSSVNLRTVEAMCTSAPSTSARLRGTSSPGVFARSGSAGQLFTTNRGPSASFSNSRPTSRPASRPASRAASEHGGHGGPEGSRAGSGSHAGSNLGSSHSPSEGGSENTSFRGSSSSRRRRRRRKENSFSHSMDVQISRGYDPASDPSRLQAASFPGYSRSTDVPPTATQTSSVLGLPTVMPARRHSIPPDAQDTDSHGGPILLESRPRRGE